MLSRRKGSLSATTEVKVLSSEIILIALGQGFHFLETNISTFVKGENVSDVPESESVAGKRIDIVGTRSLRLPGRTESFRMEASKELKRQQGGMMIR